MTQVKLESSSLWRLHHYFKPHLKRWDEDYVLFDEVSGDTHIVGQLAGFILESLMEAPMAIGSFPALIATNDNRHAEDIERLVADVMAELNALQFVEEVPC